MAWALLEALETHPSMQLEGSLVNTCTWILGAHCLKDVLARLGRLHEAREGAPTCFGADWVNLKRHGPMTQAPQCKWVRSQASKLTARTATCKGYARETYAYGPFGQVCWVTRRSPRGKLLGQSFVCGVVATEHLLGRPNHDFM